MPENPLIGKVNAFLLRADTLQEEVVGFLGAKTTPEHKKNYGEQVKDFLIRYEKLNEEAENLLGKLLEQNETLVGGIQRLAREKMDDKAQNEKLVGMLQRAKEELSALREEAEKLSAPPNSYGTFSALNEDGTINIYIGGRKMKVNLHPAIKADELKRGQELILNEASNAIAVAKFETRGEVVTVKSRLDESRVQITLRHDEEQIVEVGDSLVGVPLKEGDHLLFDSRSGMVLEKLPKSDTEDLLLEEVPSISYKDIGGLERQIEEIRRAIEWPYLYVKEYRALKISISKGVLLYGPPGCGKTLIAKAVAHQLAEEISKKRGVTIRGYFLNIKGPELLNKYVGETERQIREVFERAKEKASEDSPVVIFFDEMDSLFRMRGSGISSDMESTIVPQFLAELDGVEGLKNVIVIGASNRQDLIDPAVLRPGRFDVKIEISRPGPLDAYDIACKYLVPDLPLDASLRDEKTKTIINRLKENASPKDLERLFVTERFQECSARAQLVKEDGVREVWRIETTEEKMRFLAYRFIEDLYLKNEKGFGWKSSSGREIRFNNQFAEVTYAGGQQANLWIADVASGASIEGMITAAKKRALERLIKDDSAGLITEDFYEGKRLDMRAQGALLNTLNPDDWSKIAGKAGQRIVNARTVSNDALVFMLGGEVQSTQKKVETIPVGHYL